MQNNGEPGRPIGVFDSGVGGLTVLKSLRQRLPQQDFLYLGDTARVPYGRKPSAMVQEFAREVLQFLLAQGVQPVVIACNTASACALPELADEAPVPVWGVIEPGVEAACRMTRSGSVGVIGTKGTVASGAYQSRLEARGSQSLGACLPHVRAPGGRGTRRLPRGRAARAPLSRRPSGDRHADPRLHALPRAAKM